MLQNAVANGEPGCFIFLCWFLELRDIDTPKSGLALHSATEMSTLHNGILGGFLARGFALVDKSCPFRVQMTF